MRNRWLERLLDSVADRGRELLGLKAAPNGAPDIKALCDALLAGQGEASGIALSREVLRAYSRMDAEQRLAFFALLHDEYRPDPQRIRATAQRYLDSESVDDYLALYDAVEPPRQELLRRLNTAPHATGQLVAMRGDLLGLLREHPELKDVDADFRHLLYSWFNRGFLQLRRIDWQSPADILEKLISYEAVHAIQGWDDLRRRLAEDRRCFAFFHPSMPDEPLIFVEVALTQSIPARIQNILHDDAGAPSPDRATTAAFFGISNCQYGLRGISFGNFLLKQVVQELKQELPNLETFVTLSPVPAFGEWLATVKNGESGTPPLADAQRTALATLDEEGWWRTHAENATLRDTVRSLAAGYLTQAKNGAGMPLDPVARFHLGNGARLERINWLGDVSDKGLGQGAGLMVNYVYDLDEIERNHEQLANEGTVAMSSAVRKLARQAGRAAQ